MQIGSRGVPPSSTTHPPTPRRSPFLFCASILSRAGIFLPLSSILLVFFPLYPLTVDLDHAQHPPFRVSGACPLAMPPARALTHSLLLRWWWTVADIGLSAPTNLHSGIWLKKKKKKVYLPASSCCICWMRKRERRQRSTGLEAEVTSIEREIQTHEGTVQPLPLSNQLAPNIFISII